MLADPIAVTLRIAGTGLVVRTLDGAAMLALLTERTACGAAAAGPVGIFTLPPAPTVDQADPTVGTFAVDLLARSAYRFPPDTEAGCDAAAAAASFCFRSSSSL